MDTYYWRTEEPHSDNTETMGNYLDEHLPDDATIVLQDESYAEIRIGFQTFACRASGDGDFCWHKVQFELL